MIRYTFVLSLLATGCVLDDTQDAASALAMSQAPLPQTFFLDVTGTNAGAPVTFSVTGAAPNTPIRLVRAVGGTTMPGPCPPQLGGECLDIDGPNGIAVFNFSLTTDSVGDAERTITLPGGVADGTAVSFQAVSPAFLEGSNTVDFVVTPGPCVPDAFEDNDDAFGLLSTPPSGSVANTCGSQDFDWYVFNLLAGEQITIDLEFTQIDDIFDADMILHAAPQLNVDVGDTMVAWGTSNSDNEIFQYTAGADEAVYLAVFNYETVWGVGLAEARDYIINYTIVP
jgi:hypothetical protein